MLNGVKLLLADDHALFREGLSMIMQSMVTGSEIYTAENWKDAAAIVRQQEVDVAFVDLFMPGDMSWDEELSAFMSSAPHLPVCVVSSSGNHVHITQALKLGAQGYVRKNSGPSEISRALSKIINGNRHVPSTHWTGSPELSETASFKLTWRQKEMINHIAAGNSNKQIGALLGITESTVKRHVHNLFKALGVKSRIEAIKVAQDQRLITS